MQVGGDELVDRLDPGEHVVGVGPALLRELAEAAAHRLQPALDGARRRVVERDAPARAGDDLRDPAAHLARADDEDVLEVHGAEATAAAALRAGRMRPGSAASRRRLR